MYTNHKIESFVGIKNLSVLLDGKKTQKRTDRSLTWRI